MVDAQTGFRMTNLTALNLNIIFCRNILKMPTLSHCYEPYFIKSSLMRLLIFHSNKPTFIFVGLG